MSSINRVGVNADGILGIIEQFVLTDLIGTHEHVGVAITAYVIISNSFLVMELVMPQ